MATPEQERNIKLARFGLEAWITGDVETTREQLTEDVEVFVPPELGNAGTYRGKEEWLKWTEAWGEAWSEFDMRVEELMPVGERHVVAVVRNRGKGVGSGAEVENVLGWVLSIRDGLCDFLSLQLDRESAIRLAEEREAAEG